MDSAFDFLKCWESESGFVLIWTLPDKVSHWVLASDIPSVVSQVERVVDGRNVYIGAGLSPQALAWNERCGNDSIHGIVGLWIDVDILAPVHKKKNLPTTENEALELLHSVGPEPSFIIHSGNGFQAWWMFREPWIFEVDGDRRDAASLAAAWNKTFKIKAAESGWDLDATHDLARVMRVPGTLNQKSRPPKPVLIHSASGIRYNPAELEDFVVDRDFVQSQKVMSSFSVILNPEVVPPFDKFQALMDNNSKAKASFDRKRSDLQDQSASSYDMSLALWAAQANWTDQEIVDLLIAGRRKNGDDLKLRVDYYERTISRARVAIAAQTSESELADLVSDIEMAKARGTPLEREKARQNALKEVSTKLGVNVLRVIKYTADPPDYRIETSLGSGMIGGAKELISYTNMRARIAAITGVLLGRFTTKNWDSIVKLLLLACDEESAGSDATEEGAVSSWLCDYLSERPPMDTVEEAIVESTPYFDGDGAIFVFGPDFHRFVNSTKMEKITPKEMGVKLRSHGCTPDVLRLDYRGRRTSRSVWRLPQKYSIAQDEDPI